VRLPQAAALTTSDAAAFIDLLENLLRDQAENDGFNRLVLLAGLDGRQISILRAYSRYLRQAGLPFSQAYVAALSGDPFPDHAGTGRPLRGTLFSGSRRGTCQSLSDEVTHGLVAGQQSR
jgi:NAD-specific glutamate dehydrogenase